MLQGETVRLLGHQNLWQKAQRHVCTMSRFRRLFPKRSSTLDACLSSLAIGGRTTGFHGAGEDVVLAARLFAVLGRLERSQRKS
jgi:DNA polymerase III epsilon subunit-like protein